MQIAFCNVLYVNGVPIGYVDGITGAGNVDRGSICRTVHIEVPVRHPLPRADNVRLRLGVASIDLSDRQMPGPTDIRHAAAHATH